MVSLGFSRNPPEEWMPGGIIILTHENKIAEMSFSDHCQIDFPFLEKSVQKKLKIFAWEVIENPEKSENPADLTKNPSKINGKCSKSSKHHALPTTSGNISDAFVYFFFTHQISIFFSIL